MAAHIPIYLGHNFVIDLNGENPVTLSTTDNPPGNTFSAANQAAGAPGLFDDFYVPIDHIAVPSGPFDIKVAAELYPQGGTFESLSQSVSLQWVGPGDQVGPQVIAGSNMSSAPEVGTPTRLLAQGLVLGVGNHAEPQVATYTFTSAPAGPLYLKFPLSQVQALVDFAGQTDFVAGIRLEVGIEVVAHPM